MIPARDITDPSDRDQIFILSRGRSLVLAGNNPRSVLFAVYDYLERLGCHWLHPGPGGETLPSLTALELAGWNVKETASFRYRGVDVEGAFTPKHAKAFIAWMAKKKMNHLFMQFENCTFFYRRMVPGLKVSEAVRWDREVIAEIKKRGLLLEWYGHGWNHNAIGKRIVGLDKAYHVSDRFHPLLAEVGGRRTWHNHYPLETQLCLTNPDVHARVLRLFERVVKRNPQVDILGFWLADGCNNQCECRRCRKYRMSEMYATYVNEAAEIAHRLRPELKIEMLAYMSTLESPKRTAIRNPHGNLILMLAPLFRCYRHRLYDPGCACDEPIPTFPILNRQPRLRNADFVRFFADWRKRYSGDTYLFDYHMLALDYDFLGGNIPAIASRDIKDIANKRFDGYVGCQPLRCFWPSGLGMKVISETLWDVGKPYDAIRREHLREWFGPGALLADRMLARMYAATRGVEPAHGKVTSPVEVRASRAVLHGAATDLQRRAMKVGSGPFRHRLEFLADHAGYLSEALTLVCSTIDQGEKDAAVGRLASFFDRHARDAEFLLDAQYHGKAYRTPPADVRRKTGAPRMRIRRANGKGARHDGPR